MTDESKSLVPFGKYKGQPVERLLADVAYYSWLQMQPWFQEKYANVINVTVINSPADEDACTPEHNKMQNSFLFDDIRWAVILWHAKEFSRNTLLSHADGIRASFEAEVFNWDVFVHMRTISAQGKPKRPEASLSYPYEGDPQYREKLRLYEENLEALKHYEAAADDWSASITHPKGYRIELKPTVGEDYPAILRKICARIQRNGFQSYGLSSQLRCTGDRNTNSNYDNLAAIADNVPNEGDRRCDNGRADG